MKEMSVWLCSSELGVEVNLFLKTKEAFERFQRLLDPGSLIRRNEDYESFEFTVEQVKFCVFGPTTPKDTLAEKLG